MPKMKTHKGTAKRLGRTATGKLKRLNRSAFGVHNLSGKSKSRKRAIKTIKTVTGAMAKNAKRVGV
ncbi:MAG TPA: bL35 family ribosomal protein [Candidatus Saccharimonadales bacterium]|nr:bL35 family ribosomal protein [Candidatus Saccharimonadales bacterium]